MLDHGRSPRVPETIVPCQQRSCHWAGVAPKAPAESLGLWCSVLSTNRNLVAAVCSALSPELQHHKPEWRARHEMTTWKAVISLLSDKVGPPTWNCHNWWLTGLLTHGRFYVLIFCVLRDTLLMLLMSIPVDFEKGRPINLSSHHSGDYKGD